MWNVFYQSYDTQIPEAGHKCFTHNPLSAGQFSRNIFKWCWLLKSLNKDCFESE